MLVSVVVSTLAQSFSLTRRVAGQAAVFALGFLTAFLGLAIIMPWLAYATWHAYRETLDASGWPALD